MKDDIYCRGSEFKNRYVITATITTTAPLHIGSGDVTHRPGFVKKIRRGDSSSEADGKPAGRDERNREKNGTSVEPIDIEAIATDASGSPFIPGSVLRGCMGQWLKERKYDSKLLKGLFGWMDDGGSKFTPEMEGKVDVFPASCLTTASTPSGESLHYWDSRRLTYVARSVAIDPMTGTSDDNKLYAFELVPPGVDFKIVIGAQNLCVEEVAAILNAIEGFNDSNYPLALGAMAGRGFGKFRVDDIRIYHLPATKLNAWREIARSEADDSAGYQSIMREDYLVDTELCEKIRVAAHELRRKEKVPPFLRVQWLLRLETPLCIRSGDRFVMTMKPDCCDLKARYCKPEFDWMKRSKQDAGESKREADGKKTVEAEIADLYYGIKLDGGEAKPFYMIPASSIRGTLRSWTVHELLEKERRDVDSTLAAKEGSSSENGAGRSGCGNDIIYSITSLFGSAAGGNYSRKGRLQVYPAVVNGFNDKVKLTGLDVGASNDPGNVPRHVKVRNPLGRITQAPKEHALHYSLEVPRGETMRFTIFIKNPNEFDRKLVAYWRREMDLGIIRFGALTSSIGRGRVKVESESIEEGGGD